VCRVIQRLGPLLALRPARTSQDAVERMWADATAWRDSGLAAHCQGVTVLGDGLHHAVQAVARMHNLPRAA
jgi:hypothetical protein